MPASPYLSRSILMTVGASCNITWEELHQARSVQLAFWPAVRVQGRAGHLKDLKRRHLFHLAECKGQACSKHAHDGIVTDHVGLDVL